MKKTPTNAAARATHDTAKKPDTLRPTVTASPYDPCALLGVAWSKAGAEKIDLCDFAVGKGAVQLLLDQVRLALLDTAEPVRDVHSVRDFLAPRVEEMELGRVAEPSRDQRRNLTRANAFSEPYGVSARSSASWAKHSASAGSSCSAIACTKRVPSVVATAGAYVLPKSTSLVATVPAVRPALSGRSSTGSCAR